MAEGSGDRGGMLAVNAPLATVENVLREERSGLILANRNAPSQAVLSGATEQIVRARDVFARRQIASKTLSVAAAFHSPFVADARGPFLEAFATIDVHPTEVEVFSNSTAREYPRNPQETRALLAGQLAEQVDFVAEIDNMYQAGVRTFLEVGPGNKLSGLIGSILAGRPHEVLTLDASSGKRSGCADLARVLAQLAALGHQLELSHWDAGQAEKKMSAEKKPTLTVPICGANYVKPKENRPVQLPLRNASVKPAVKPNVSAPMSANGAGSSETDKAIVRPGEKAAVENGRPHADQPRENGHITVAAGQHVSQPATAALAMTQDNLIALQRLGEQTAQLHRQFLEGQDRACRCSNLSSNSKADSCTEVGRRRPPSRPKLPASRPCRLRSRPSRSGKSRPMSPSPLQARPRPQSETVIRSRSPQLPRSRGN